MKPTLYTDELISEYLNNGCWEHKTLRELCHESSMLYPDKTALVDSKRRVTWGEVADYSEQLALSLVKLGFSKDSIILIQLYNSIELFLTLVAAEKAGVIVAACPPNFRHAEIESIAQKTATRGIIIGENTHGFDYFRMVKDLRPNLTNLKQVIFTGTNVPRDAISFWELISRKLSTTVRYIGMSPFEVCRLGTTSGTTGTPKLSENAFSAYLSAAKSLAKRIKFTPDDVVGAMYNITGGGVSLIAGVIVPLYGARCVLMERLSAEQICELIARENITVLALVPAQIVRLAEMQNVGEYNLTSLRLIVSSTSQLPQAFAKTIESTFSCPVLQTYGAMDKGAIGSGFVDDPTELRLQMIGKPYDCNQLKLVGEDDEEVPEGEVGEVMVRGASMVGGYFGNLTLTGKEWLNGWAHTGDLGCLDKKGYLKFVGRQKDIIIRGGRNIIPKEVEEILLKHPKVLEAVVVKMPDLIMGEKACAYIVPKHGKKLTFKEITRFLKGKKLAPYKLPERLEIIEIMPLVPAGQKIDRKRLEEDVASKLEK
jgi:non-ribosomal peptide synthetase component E (peptide arylation enzyme)